MKYKKYSYIIVLILTLVIGINKTYADSYRSTNNETLVWQTNETTTKTYNNNYGKLQPIANDYGNEVNVDCQTIFGDPNNPNSLRYLINEILQYPKIIVPILVILLGTIDFAKAVISSKEDGMKKAQTTFVKRLIIAVAIFFVPVIMDILMWLADIVWAGTGYSGCQL